jgi:O-antigen polysaccharide polymerase Wzy
LLAANARHLARQAFHFHIAGVLVLAGGIGVGTTAAIALSGIVRDVSLVGPVIGICAICGAVIISYVTSRRSRDAFEPVFLIALTAGLGFAGGAIYSSTGLGSQSANWGPQPGVLMGFVGLAFLLAGYFAMRRPLAPVGFGSLDEAWDSGRAVWLGIMCVIVGTIGYFGAIQNGEYFAYSTTALVEVANSTWSFFASFLFAGLTILSISCFRSASALARAIPWLLGTVVTAALLPTGIRYALLYVAVSVAVPYHYHRARLHPILFPIFLAAVVVLLLPIGELYRNEYRSTNASSPAVVAQLVANTARDVSNLGPGGYVQYALDNEFQRVDFASVASAVQAVVPSEIPHQYGATYLAIPLGFIPRILWPDKPTYQFDNEIGRVSGYLQPNDYRTSIKYGYFGEAYLNFGWLGLTVGLFMIGMMFRIAYAKLVGLQGRQSPTATLLYSLILLDIATIETPLGPAIGGATREAVVLVVLLWLLTRARRTASKSSISDASQPRRMGAPVA